MPSQMKRLETPTLLLQLGDGDFLRLAPAR